MSVEKKRVNVILTKHYLDALTHLVKEGVYIDRGSAIRAALRLLFTFHGVPPFARARSRCGQMKFEEEKREKEDDRETTTSETEGPICGG